MTHAGRTVALALLGGAVLGSLVTLAVAVRVGDTVGGTDRPTAADAASPVTVPVVRQVLEDTETVAGALSWADTETVVADDGVVTAMPVPDRQPVTPGQVVIEVNDHPVAALHMPFSPWRDLVDGDLGADARALHEALAELGLYQGALDAPVGPATREALDRIDPRLADGGPVPARSVVAVDPTGSTLAAPAVGVGTRLGETTVAVRRQTDRIAVDDGGIAAEYAAPDQQIRLFDADGVVVWEGTISAAEVASSRTVLTVTDSAALPPELVAAEIVVERTAGEVLAVPRLAMTPHADGTTTVRVTGSGTEPRDVVVRSGLCARDLCEVTVDPDEPTPLGAGDLVVVG